MTDDTIQPVPPMAWCRTQALAPRIACFFVAHAGPSYISHSELQFGRAEAPDRWSPDLDARIEADARQAIANAVEEAPAGMRCGLSMDGAEIAGMAFVRFVLNAKTPFAILEDLLIRPDRRGGGLGRRLLDWIAAECRGRGCARLFLESGLGNDRAHHFFEAQGFAQTSIVMMRTL